MAENYDTTHLAGKQVHFVGIKGTGMSALAELYVRKAACVTGSDVAERFYTDSVLEALGIKPCLFNASNISPSIDLVIHSAAYKKNEHPELVRAAALGIPILEYPVALGAYSKMQSSFAISGVHGKTTTTALMGTIAQYTHLPATVLAGSSVTTFGNKSTCMVGSNYFIAETCEYRCHFLNFKASIIVVTSIESDHQDFFPDYQSMLEAFVAFALTLPPAGYLIYCADDAGATELALRILNMRPDILLKPYGYTAQGDFNIQETTPNSITRQPGQFYIAGYINRQFSLRIPGRHIIQDAVAAIALYCSILDQNEKRKPSENELTALVTAINSFAGSKRRAEIIGTVNDILIMDDYAHHPTAIRLTLQGLKEFYPQRRLIVDFMSHTYSRTETLFKEFTDCFGAADKLILHDIYPSAREKTPEHYNVTGRKLFEAVRNTGINCVYYDNPLDALPYVQSILQPGDLFISLGAGENWVLSQAIYQKLTAGVDV